MINPAPPGELLSHHTRELPTHPSGGDSHIYPPLSSLTDSFHDMMTVARIHLCEWKHCRGGPDGGGLP